MFKKTTHGPRRDERVSRREKRKTSRVLKTFFSRAFEEGFFFARREEEEEEEVVHSFVRVIFFFSKGRSKKGVALSRFPKRKARETNERQTRRTEHNNDDDDDDDDVFFFVFFFSAHARARSPFGIFFFSDRTTSTGAGFKEGGYIPAPRSDRRRRRGLCRGRKLFSVRAALVRCGTPLRWFRSRFPRGR